MQERGCGRWTGNRKSIWSGLTSKISPLDHWSIKGADCWQFVQCRLQDWPEGIVKLCSDEFNDLALVCRDNVRC